jgi:translation elongation factor EF-Tu-like GTPase
MIRTVIQLKQEIELLKALDDIEVAFNCLQKTSNTNQNPIDEQYEQLKCQLKPIEKNDQLYTLLETYLQTTHASTHQQYQMQIEDIFEIDRSNEKQMFNDVGNKMLLW